MKKYLAIGLGVVAVILLSVFLIVPIFAQESQPTDSAWQQMHQACLSGDWQGMRDAMQNLFGSSNGNDYGPCHGGYGAAGQGNTSWRGGGMMGWY